MAAKMYVFSVITRRLLLLAVLFLATAFAHILLARNFAQPPLPASPKRIVSLAPSVTETLYAIGLGAEVAAVTRFCEYPPEVKTKPKVAGFFGSVDYEALLRVRPDMVVLPVDQAESLTRLRQLGLPTLSMDTRSLGGLLTAIEVLGKGTHRAREADELLGTIRLSMDAAKKRAEGRAKPKVLFSVMHAYEGLGRITEINAVGSDGFYSELIAMAGGENVYRGPLAFPRLSREAIMYLDPDVIIDVVPPYVDMPTVLRDWLALSSVSAVRKGRVFVFSDEADTVPGPRFYQTLTKLSLAFHPSAAESDGRTGSE